MAARILVIRGGAIGDFILTLPTIRLLRDNFPNAHLEILGYRHILSLAEGRFYAQATRSIEYSALSGFFIPNSKLAPDLVEFFAGFQQVVSYLYDPDGIFEANVRRCGVRHFLSGSPKLDESSHAAEQLARPLQSLALYLEDRAARFFPNASDIEKAECFLSRCSAPLIALHPGSGSPRKNWPIENWARLGEKLAGKGLSLLVVTGEADKDNLAFLEANWSFSFKRARDLPLPELGAVLARCALFVGHDSGISHLAAAAQTPSLLMFGPTDPSVWAPCNSGVEVVQAPSGRLAELSVEEIEARILQTLARADISG